MDLSPLKNNRDFRFLYFGQFVSFLGAMLTFVALPYQIYQLTNSTLAVGLISIAELIPLLLSAFIGGAYADSADRRKIIMMAEAGMGLGCLVLAVNALLAHPHVWVLYAVGALNGALFRDPPTITRCLITTVGPTP